MPSFTTLDPQADLNLEVGFIAMHVFSRLVDNDENGKIYPSLLKDMPKVSPDGLTYFFELRHDIKFSTGEKLNSFDVKFTFERMLRPETKGNKSTWVFDTIKGAKDLEDGKAKDLSGFKILDINKFEIQLDKPYAPFIQGLATAYASIFPEKECTEFKEEWNSKIIGSGPFKVLSWEKDKEIVLVKNENYFGTKPKLDKIVNTIVDKSHDDFAKTQVLYDLGELDIISIPADKYNDYKDDPKYKNDLQVIQNMNTRYLTLNNQNGIFKDQKVRQAISLAIDRKKLCDVILNGSAIPAYTIIPKGIDGYDENAGIEFNVEKSKELLKEAGYPKGFTIDYLMRYKAVQPMDFAIQGMLQQIGIKLNMIAVYDDNKFYEIENEGKYTMSLSNWCADIPDADNFMYNLFYSKMNRLSKYKNQHFDDMCDEARRITDLREREEIYKSLDKLLCRQDWATVPISHNIEVILKKPNLKGVYINPITNMQIFWNASKQ
jgi:oligopeptide transport system substrate-binding protein